MNKALLLSVIFGLTLCCPLAGALADSAPAPFISASQGQAIGIAPAQPRPGVQAAQTIWASQGTDTAQVIVYWTETHGIVSYDLWRYTTFDVNYASKIASVSVTNFNDTSAIAGMTYYYWVQPVYALEVRGPMSDYTTGYRGLLPPQTVTASDGTYTNKVVVTWAPANEASSYEVYRSSGATATEGTVVYRTDGLTFTDILVSEDVQYWYQVKTLKSPYSSALSTAEAGSVLAKPTGVSATKGTYEGLVGISWNAVGGATGYEVWRNTVALSQSATKLGDATSAAYSDSSAAAGTTYYYWIKAKNTTATSTFSGADNGFAATGSTDLKVWDLALLPTSLPPGTHPAMLSFRMENNGPSALAAPNTTLRLSFYMGRTPSISDAVAVGSADQSVTLAVGESAVVKVNSPGSVTMPVEAGDYYVFIRALPVWPNLLADASQGDNETVGIATIHVAPGVAPHYWAVNDYDGDGISDMAVYNQGQGIWEVRTVEGSVLGENVLFGDASFTSAVGDYDGDQKADPAIYDATRGLWMVMLSGSAYATAYAYVGETGCVPVPGDYDGDAKADLVVYRESSGEWTGLLSASGYAQASGFFGGPGMRPVAGDYDGDGIWDLAVYSESTATWFIRTPAGKLLKWGFDWGGPGYIPVSGDYDGDGAWDLTLYNESIGYWIVLTATRSRSEYWGGWGYVPVPGDFDGDGIWDLAVYRTSNSKWDINSLQKGVITFSTLWGSSATMPVRWQ